MGKNNDEIELFDAYSDKKIIVDLSLAKKVKNVVSKGLTSGVGERKPGSMCVEAAVCYAIGQEHGDQPICVDEKIIQAKIKLNDNFRGTKKQRAHALRRVAIAQLGTRGKFDKGSVEAIIDGLVLAFVTSSIASKIAELGIPKTTAQLEIFDSEVQEIKSLMNRAGADFDLEDLGEVQGIIWDALPDFTKNKNDVAVAITAEILTQALIKAKSPGSKFLHLVPLTADEKKLFAPILPKPKGKKGKK